MINSSSSGNYLTTLVPHPSTKWTMLNFRDRSLRIISTHSLKKRMYEMFNSSALNKSYSNGLFECKFWFRLFQNFSCRFRISHSKGYIPDSRYVISFGVLNLIDSVVLIPILTIASSSLGSRSPHDSQL